MMNEIRLIPGIPRDENREYLPLYLKESAYVVNENGNNSQVYPKNLKEYREKIIDDVVDEWYVYVPDSYDASKKTPLVFSMHGGIMSGWAQCIYTSWSHVADREGFIVVFPSAHLRGFWQIECEPHLFEMLSAPNADGIFMHPFPENLDEDFDVRKVFYLLDRIKSEYHIDEERIYMQGMSLGNAMTAMMARHYGNRFAAMAGSAGPSTAGLLWGKDEKPVNEAGPVNVWQTRMQLDQAAPGEVLDVLEAVKKNRDYWLTINECETLPKIKLDGENNFAFYTGKKANFVFRDVFNRDHGQTFDDAEYVWDYMFSGCRRLADGSLVCTDTNDTCEGDDVSLAVGDDFRYAWVSNEKTELPAKAFLKQKLKYHGLGGDAIVRGEYIMVPAAFLAGMYGENFEEKDGRAVLTMKDGRRIQIARGCVGCTIDNKVRSMLVEAEERDGMLFISAEWFCREVMGFWATTCDGVMYATDHYSVLSVHMAKILRDICK